MKFVWPICLVVLPIVSAIATSTGNSSAVVIVILAAITLIGLAVFDKISTRYHPWLLASIGLAMAYQTSLASAFLVGSDIHLEYYHALDTFTTGMWNYSNPCAYNSDIGVTVGIPLLAKTTGIDMMHIFQIGLPVLLASSLIPLYYLFKNQLSSKIALAGGILLIITPTFFLEMPSAARQEITQLFLALCLLMIVVKVEKLGKWQFPIIIALGVAVVLNHYAMWVMLLIFIAVILATRLILDRFGISSRMPARHLAAILAILLVIGLGYFYSSSSGVILGKLVHLVPFDVPDSISTYVIEHLPSEAAQAQGPESATTTPIDLDKIRQALVLTATGQDFAASDIPSKVFRVIQYVIQVLIIVGCIYTAAMVVRRKSRNLNTEYLGLVAAGTILIAMAVFIPMFAWALNASRIYWIALMVLAPMAVVGGQLLFRNIKILVIAIMIPYLVFSSGLVFEATKYTELEVVTIPYSFALSNHRLDLTGSYTDSDVAAVWWAKEHDLELYGDLHSYNLMNEAYGLIEVRLLPNPLDNIPEYAYILLRDRNIRDSTLVYWTGTGTRQFTPFEYEEVTNGRDIIYQQGNTIILGRKASS